MSRRLRGSTTILFLLLQTPEPAAQPFTDGERTVYPRHPLPILFHHLLVPPSLSLPVCPPICLSLSLSRFSRPDSTTSTRSLFLSGATIGLGRQRRIHYAFVQFAEFWDRAAVVGGGGRRKSSTRKSNGKDDEREERGDEKEEEEEEVPSKRKRH